MRNRVINKCIGLRTERPKCRHTVAASDRQYVVIHQPM